VCEQLAQGRFYLTANGRDFNRRP